MSFSTMYVGATGVVAHGDKMQVVGNNLANISTVGYKRADARFADLMSTTVAGASAQYQSGAIQTSQIGKGVGIGEIRSIFNEGGLENTETTTDLAITGNGFFGVRKVVGADVVATGASHFTRAGNFRFNNDAYLVDPHGYRLQGYSVDRETNVVSTSLSDVQLPYEDVIIDGQQIRQVRSDPKMTSSIEMITNLDALASDLHTSTSNPFFAMLDSYNGNLSNASTPFGDSPPAYSSSLNIFDEDGNTIDMTVYFDPVSSNTISNATPGYSYWEYVVAVPGDNDGTSAYGTSSAGLMGLGVLTFNGSGELVNHAAYSLNTASGAGGKSLGAWQAATFDEEGHPQMAMTFGSNGSAIGTTQTMSLDFGLNSTTGSWVSNTGTPASVGVNANNLLDLANEEREVRSSTSFDSGSATIYQNQDGYSWGYLQNTSIDRDGFLTGHFSNGQSEKFYQISVFRFNSEWGLRRVGNNNFVATEASGNAIAGKPDEGGRGTMQQNTLEQSNVDMAQEFADMILTQRGYQANTKVITTADTLLNTTINIKR
ncbi:flagellar hook-basal body complex protein [Pseudodesulfovibrio sp. zrk46]|uniref:flagellar hook protein FlgE n=1 Tax=Pseudodesulfovibrio sp. zrk46 TaxID=2725288 RepID=UPI001448A7E8|nr:flagellar hook-basal body complex protein [Pseudodesulfovibrio sp. zrk46]QJB56206.1 flagellar hook-basal body complex protein [Pseudodesulfovibrio sp. zrk46]